ncbi:flagellar biosynthesis anti-sigma factor FlgM [Bacillus infantis]|uniref:flagellar biosynthesis anti-sigma factor FlgM n=1 Tax=Bacillus infantis TaxID=324767 RepID=UPI003CE9D008
MKINQNFGASGINPYKRQLNNMDNQSKETKKTDKVEISSAAKEMQQVSQLTAKRQAKVEELKLQVQNGTYQVDAKETAKSILKFYGKE